MRMRRDSAIALTYGVAISVATASQAADPNGGAVEWSVPPALHELADINKLNNTELDAVRGTVSNQLIPTIENISNQVNNSINAAKPTLKGVNTARKITSAIRPGLSDQEQVREFTNLSLDTPLKIVLGDSAAGQIVAEELKKLPRAFANLAKQIETSGSSSSIRPGIVYDSSSPRPQSLPPGTVIAPNRRLSGYSSQIPSK